MEIQKTKAGLNSSGFFKVFNKKQAERFVWLIPNIDTKEVIRISDENNFSLPIASILYSRGFRSIKEINSFIFSSFKSDVHDPKLLKDAETAANRLMHAIKIIKNLT